MCYGPGTARSIRRYESVPRVNRDEKPGVLERIRSATIELVECRRARAGISRHYVGKPAYRPGGRIACSPAVPIAPPLPVRPRGRAFDPGITDHRAVPGGRASIRPGAPFGRPAAGPPRFVTVHLRTASCHHVGTVAYVSGDGNGFRSKRS
jgi:hypothetical protein